ncbi:hypothetical protein GWE18_36790 [Bradyrhizobium sp. CSA112]|uniref:hypothetical protein n=1 Tax=Bradyrhizobium sp. CSA112 TaxID=2699170 RepID=UPI0023B0F178|nr:hypothetical protein [Bradyrhizobium sp. CSA112]MDE5458266.1 hypothetical protein [Bradyrhizobium sp. CSA112]
MRRAVIDLGQPGMPAGAFLFAASSHSQKVKFSGADIRKKYPTVTENAIRAAIAHKDVAA